MVLASIGFASSMLAPPGSSSLSHELQPLTTSSLACLPSASTTSFACFHVPSPRLCLPFNPTYVVRSHRVHGLSSSCKIFSSDSVTLNDPWMSKRSRAIFHKKRFWKLSTRSHDIFKGDFGSCVLKTEITYKEWIKFYEQRLPRKCEVAVSSSVETSESSSAVKRSRAKRKKPEGEPMEPEYYKMGYLRGARAYGIQFKEGPDGVGVFSAKDLPYLIKPRMIMEIPLELLITVSKYPPWLFFPNIVPIGHPIFDIINATDAEIDWDMRLAILLLLAMDKEGSFWHLYSDYLPEEPESTDLIFASEEELDELQDTMLAQNIREEKTRIEEAWKKYWTPDMILKIKRLARTSEKFKWAVSIARTRCITMSMGVGTMVQEANMLVPYADMLNHSFTPTCSLRWRTKDRILEVLINVGQSVKQGEEMTLNYLDHGADRDFMRLYGLSSQVNPWNKLNFSGKSRIHLDSFLSAFNIAGQADSYYYNEAAADRKDTFVNGAVLAMARDLPSWSDADVPFLPSKEKQAVKDLKKECRLKLAAFPTTLEYDKKMLAAEGESRSLRWKAIIKYRIDRKSVFKKVTQALNLYLRRLLY